ncbi:MAG TPA: GGDEF domain-containing protein [Bryobacteraceae bacterium]
MAPIVVEVLATLLFAGVLVYLRSTLSRSGLLFWVALWLLRGGTSLIAMRFVPATESLVLLLYAPIQITLSVALILIAVRLQCQQEQLRSLGEQLLRLRREAGGQRDMDTLTGLHSRAALACWLEQEGACQGLVVVCDMDDFKQINDRFGHLVGDEILHGVGNLIASSIRETDRAFRWGGDEFVILFESEDTDLVNSRMRRIEERLAHFQIRQHGTIPVQFSWGLAATAGRPLRESLEAADRLMYESKRTRRLSEWPGTK